MVRIRNDLTETIMNKEVIYKIEFDFLKKKVARGTWQISPYIRNCTQVVLDCQAVQGHLATICCKKIVFKTEAMLQYDIT